MSYLDYLSAEGFLHIIANCRLSIPTVVQIGISYPYLPFRACYSPPLTLLCGLGFDPQPQGELYSFYLSISDNIILYIFHISRTVPPADTNVIILISSGLSLLLRF